MIDKLNVGDRLFVAPSINDARNGRGGDGQYMTVSKIGRKYFHFQELVGTEFRIDTWDEVTNYSQYAHRIYKCEQDFLDNIRKEKLLRLLEHNFRYANTPKHSLDELEAVVKILDLEKDGRP